jgi:hypothetical protein
MSNIIEDGKGSGIKAAVTPNNRMMTTGIDLTLTEAATESGDTYNLNSAETTLNTTNESALFYLKNLEDTNLIVTNIVVNIMDYVGTDGQPVLTVYRNPTGGTIVSGASGCNEQNRNYSSNKTLSRDCFQGTEGKTITGADNTIPVYLPSTAVATLVSFDPVVVLPKGSSIGLSWTPPAGMTSVKIITSLEVTLNGTQL